MSRLGAADIGNCQSALIYIPIRRSLIRKFVMRSKQYFDIIRNMKTLGASEILSALGHESRLAIFRLLVEAGADGLNASAIGEQLGMIPATLSFHLAHLNRVGLIKGKQKSRFIYYSADYGVMDDLIAFLTQNCCQGSACLPKSAAVVASSKTAKNVQKASTPRKGKS